MITPTNSLTPVYASRSDATKAEVEKAYREADQLILSSHAALRDHTATLEDLAATSAASRAHFLAAVGQAQP